MAATERFLHFFQCEDDVDPADYKRPSAQQQSEENDDPDDEKEDHQSQTTTTDDNVPAADAQIPDTKPADSTADKGGVKNYYYYTYTNSLNKTHTDDHSTHNKTINDDHSTGKHINSDNGLSAEDIQKIKKDDGMYHKLESAAPWELDLGIPEPMMETAGIDNISIDIIFDYMRKTAAIVSKNNPDVMKDIDDIISDPKKFFTDNTDEDDHFRNTYQWWTSIEDYGFHQILSYPQFVLMDKGFVFGGFDHHVPVDEFVSGIKRAIETLGYNVNFDFDSLDNNQTIYDWFDAFDKAVSDYKLIDCDVIGDEYWLSVAPASIVNEYNQMHEVLKAVFDNSATDKILREYYNQKYGEEYVESVMTEEVGDADDMKPESDHPVKDIAMDIDRKTAKMHQKAKKAVQDTMNAGRAIAKPINRTKDWISNMVVSWRDADETKVKERMADPQQRKGLLNAIRKAIRIGALAKAGLLFNPIILFLTVTKKIGDNKKSYRIRNEMIGELKTEMEVIAEKIKDADAAGDKNAKYKLMRFKNEINKKLLRVGGGTRWDKVI